MKEYTGYKDGYKKPINEGDILYNSFVGDLWIVEKVNDVYCANLIPNSGLIDHGAVKYPAHTENLEDIAENTCFTIIGNRYEGGNNG